MSSAVRLTLGLALAAAPAAAQITSTLGPPDAEISEPFTRLRAVGELPNGNVLTTDTRDKLVLLVDFKSDRSVKVGREGQGPGEYSLPGEIFVLPNGTALVHDLLNRRFLSIDQTGKTGATLAVPGGPGQGPGGMMFGDLSGYADGRGRMYFRAPPIDFSGPEPRPVDSMAILRWNRVDPKLDTVAWIRPASNSASASGSRGQVVVRIGASKVFTAEESFGVAADGSVARVTPSPYRVIWYPPNGRPVIGPPIDYTPLEVTAADRKQVIEARKRERPMMIAIGGNGRRVQAPAVKRLPDPEFERTKPPFYGPGAVRVTPEGEVWVLRTRPASDDVPSYDVFDRAGRVIRRVKLAPKSRVVGFGKGVVYLARVDEDDLEHLQRFKR